MTIFVFEGIDKAGKTTLIKEVGRALDLKIFTVKRPAENGWEALTEFRQGKIDAENIINYARKNPDFLLDRFIYSELVYAKLFERPCDFPWYKTFLKKNKDILKVIHVDEKSEIIIHRWQKENLPIENALKIMVEYNNLWYALGLVQDTDYIRFKPSQDKIKTLLFWIYKNGQNSL